MPKDFGFSILVFIAVCGFFVFQHLVFGFRRSYGFSVLLCDVVFGFSCFVLLTVFGFARIFMRFWVIFFFGFAVSNIPQCPPPLGACNRSTVIYLEINLIEEFKIHAKIEKEMITLTFIRRNTKFV